VRAASRKRSFHSENGEARAIGVFLNGDELDIETQRGDAVHDDSFLILFNGHYEDMRFRLPARRFGGRWQLELATGRCECDRDRCVAGADVLTESRSVALFRRA
jgi:glycogen operon protein